MNTNRERSLIAIYNIALDTTLDSKLTLEVALECQRGQMMIVGLKIISILTFFLNDDLIKVKAST